MDGHDADPRRMDGHDTDPRQPAARSNASWCDAVCRSHALPTHQSPDLWWTATRSPEFHPDAVTLRPGVSSEQVLAGIDRTAGCSVKDSFATLSLRPAGFRTLFDAQWIRLEAGVVTSAPQLSWRAASTESEVANWLEAHGEAYAVTPELARQYKVQLFSARVGGGMTGGLALNFTTEAVGVSNVFGPGAGVEEIWADVAPLAARVFPGLPLVGYELEEGLGPALTAGFRVLGPLRVWIH